MPGPEDRIVPMGMGMTDTRPQMSVVEGRLIDRPEPKLAEIEPQSLEQLIDKQLKSINPENLPAPEIIESVVRAVQIISKIKDLSVEDKRKILAYFLWERDGGIGLLINLLGANSPARVHSLTDPVMEREDLGAAYDEFYRKYSKGPDQEGEFLHLLKEGLSYQDAGEEMDLTQGEAYRVYLGLVRSERFEPRPTGLHNANKFRDLRRKVRRASKKNKLLHRQLAQELGSNISSISNARRSLIGEIDPLTKDEISDIVYAEAREKRRRVMELRLNSNLENEEIARELGISLAAVEHHVTILIEQELIPDKRSQNKERAKAILEQEMGEHLMREGTGKTFSLIKLIKEKKVNIRYPTLVNLYEAIKLERVVPPIKRRKKRGQANPE